MERGVGQLGSEGSVDARAWPPAFVEKLSMLSLRPAWAALRALIWVRSVSGLFELWPEKFWPLFSLLFERV